MSDSDSLKVLVTDDEDGVRRFVARVLTQSGHNVVEAQNGRVALAHLGERNVARGQYAAVHWDQMRNEKQFHFISGQSGQALQHLSGVLMSANLVGRHTLVGLREM